MFRIKTLAISVISSLVVMPVIAAHAQSGTKSFAITWDATKKRVDGSDLSANSVTYKVLAKQAGATTAPAVLAANLSTNAYTAQLAQGTWVLTVRALAEGQESSDSNELTIANVGSDDGNPNPGDGTPSPGATPTPSGTRTPSSAKDPIEALREDGLAVWQPTSTTSFEVVRFDQEGKVVVNTVKAPEGSTGNFFPAPSSGETTGAVLVDRAGNAKWFPAAGGDPITVGKSGDTLLVNGFVPDTESIVSISGNAIRFLTRDVSTGKANVGAAAKARAALITRYYGSFDDEILLLTQSTITTSWKNKFVKTLAKKLKIKPAAAQKKLDAALKARQSPYVVNALDPLVDRSIRNKGLRFGQIMLAASEAPNLAYLLSDATTKEPQSLFTLNYKTGRVFVHDLSGSRRRLALPGDVKKLVAARIEQLPNKDGVLEPSLVLQTATGAIRIVNLRSEYTWPAFTVADIFKDAAPGIVKSGALVLENDYAYFPVSTKKVAAGKGKATPTPKPRR